MSDERQTVSTGTPWEERFGYSRAVRVDRFVSVSGTVGRNADGSVPAGAYLQAKRALEIIAAALDEVGAGPQHVVRTRTFVTDVAAFGHVARAHQELFAETRPATTFVGVSALLAPEFVLEIEADAIIG
ncbi:MAG: RidA family protein [Candidatus Dormibacteria bacterium]